MRTLLFLLLLPVLAQAQIVGRSSFYTPTTAAASGPSYFNVGTYTGDGDDNKAISVGFQPALVIVKGAGATYGVWRTSDMTGDSTAIFGDGVLVTDCIQSLSATGFVVGTNATVNSNGVAYHWQAWKADAASLVVSHYTGSGSDNNAITGVGFAPDFVMLKANRTAGNAYGHTWWKSKSWAADAASTFLANNFDSNSLQSLDADGFTLGSAEYCNASGYTYYYVAFKEVTDYAWEGTYTGNATDNRDISATTAKPDLVWPLITNTSYKMFATSTETASYNLYFYDAAENTAGDMIKVLNNDGFRVSGDAHINADGVAVYYMCWKIR